MDNQDRIAELERKIKAAEDKKRAAELESYARDLLKKRGLPADSLELVTGNSEEQTAYNVDKLKALLANRAKPEQPTTELEKLKAQLQDMLDKGVRLEYRLPIVMKIKELEKQGG